MTPEETTAFQRRVRRDAVVHKIEHIYRMMRIGAIGPRRALRLRRVLR